MTQGVIENSLSRAEISTHRLSNSELFFRIRIDSLFFYLIVIISVLQRDIDHRVPLSLRRFGRQIYILLAISSSCLFSRSSQPYLARWYIALSATSGGRRCNSLGAASNSLLFALICLVLVRFLLARSFVCSLSRFKNFQ